MLLLLCVVALWIWGAVLLRRRYAAVALVVILPLAFVSWLSIPGRTADPDVLRAAYVNCLQGYKGTLYVWGGENRIGIDCSGLVRRALINANTGLGIKTLTPSESMWFTTPVQLVRWNQMKEAPNKIVDHYVSPGANAG